MRTRKFSRREESSFASSLLRWFGAFLVLLIALVLPERLGDIRMPAAPRLPVELPLLVLALMLFAGPLRAVVRTLLVLLLTVLVVFKLAHMGTYFGFDRPFNPLADVMMIPTLLDITGRAGGSAAPIAAVVGVILLITVIIAGLTWATGVIVRGVGRNGRIPLAVIAAIVAALMFVPQTAPYVGPTAGLFVRDQSRAIVQDVRDARIFRAQLLEQPFQDVPPDHLLANLKGTDVLLVFVESYGRAALDKPDIGPKLHATLHDFDAALKDKGFSARSAWVNSPTFGGESYLAHSTFVSGLWINNQQRFAQLLRSERRTLINDFNAAGWRTVAVMPAITTHWPEGEFFRYGKIYRAPELGYKGAPFSFLTMPDQYALAAFQTQELAPADRSPVMAEIALLSSHIPWMPLPKLLPWDEIGDGSIFTTARIEEADHATWQQNAPEYYAQSLDYSLRTLMSFITTFAGDNTLLIILGDHQPMSFMAGDDASHEVPIHIIARNPALLTALDEGAWAEGMEPLATSPSWSMETMRERIIGAFTARPDAPQSSPPESEAEPAMPPPTSAPNP